MNVFDYIFIALAITMAVTLICMAIIITRASDRSVASISRTKQVQGALEVFANPDAAPSRKASAGFSLIAQGWVLVHVMGNKGRSYNDERQTELFCDSLTNESVSALKTLKGRVL